MNQPSKEELKLKYGISNDDFVILQESYPPKPETLMKDGAYMEKAGWFGKFEVWLKRSLIGGLVLAVILIGGFISGLEKMTEYGYAIYSNREVISEYIEVFSDYAQDEAHTFLVSTSPSPTEEDKEQMKQLDQWGIMPTGSYFAPLSSSYKV